MTKFDSEQLRHALIVSCQAAQGAPLDDPTAIALMAASAEVGGARAIRANGPEHVAAIKAAVTIPVIGLTKRRVEGFPVYITPALADADHLAEAGADLIAVDGTADPRPGGATVTELIRHIREVLAIPVIADIDGREAAIAARDAGADLVATTLSGYTGERHAAPDAGPDVGLVRPHVGARLPDHRRRALPISRRRRPRPPGRGFRSGRGAVDHRSRHHHTGVRRIDVATGCGCRQLLGAASVTGGLEGSPQPTDVDLLFLNGVVVTMDRDRRILADGAVAVHRDRIVGVGRSSELRRAFRARRSIDMGGGVLQPGFVDSHVHLSQHLGRGSIPDTWPELREHDHWLPYWLNMTEEDAYLSALLACLEMVHNGTTTFCDMGGRFEAEISARAARDVGLRGLVSEICWDLPPYPEVSVGDTDACLERLDRLARRFPVDADNLLRGGFGLAGMGQCSDELLQRAKALANDHGAVLYLHQSFGDPDVATYREATGGVLAVEHLDGLGVLDSNTALVHMNRVEESELELLRLRRSSVVHCPSASTRVGMRSSVAGQFPEMVQSGINVALGSDSGNYSDFFDIGREAYLAATIHREARGVMPTISAEQALEMATINGASALGVGIEVGSIDVGKKADLVLHRYARPEWRPGGRTVNNLIYSAQSVGVDLVTINGAIVLENGHSTLVDEAAAYRAIDAAAKSLSQRMGFRPEQPWPVVL